MEKVDNRHVVTFADAVPDEPEPEEKVNEAPKDSRSTNEIQKDIFEETINRQLGKDK